VPSLNELARTPWGEGSSLGQAVHIVHVLVIEPHPQPPDPSPYSGRPAAMAYSTRPQSTTFEQRLEAAEAIAPLLEGDQLVLIDELAPPASVDPVWCTYGPAPNSAFLIRQDGILKVVQAWLDVEAMEAAILRLLGEPGPSDTSLRP
jgi:hypothetical protein